MKINKLKKQWHLGLIHTWSDKVFKGTVVYRTLPSLLGGSKDITITVPITEIVNLKILFKINQPCPHKIKNVSRINGINSFWLLSYFQSK